MKYFEVVTIIVYIQCSTLVIAVDKSVGSLSVSRANLLFASCCRHSRSLRKYMVIIDESFPSTDRRGPRVFGHVSEN